MRFVCCNSVYLSGYRNLGDGDTDQREILHDGISIPDTKFPLKSKILAL